MLFRAIALSVALLIGIGTIIPLGTNDAEAGPRKSRKYNKQKKYKKYSKRWWRQYRARMNRNRSLQTRRRSMRLRQLRLARKRPNGNRTAKPVVTARTNPSLDRPAAVLPSGQAAPAGWRPGASTSGEINFSVDNGNGSASISVVGPATGETVETGRNRTVGGVPTTALRREVINRMIRENGWVVNDYQKSIGNRSVYVVVAQSQSGGRVHSRMFYFTEADGRIYSVATNSAADAADRIAAESEKVIFSLSGPRPVQQAAIRED